ncbi:MAG TPA: PAS domain S-box protein [Smithella sp.]|nr:PAS domain S-box protein [Smithella sp.]
MKDKSLLVLFVEDSEDDALLISRELERGGYHPDSERVETASAMKEALGKKQWDIILCDYKMPDFSAPSAIALLKELNIDIPVIIISGAIGEETAVECMRLGARDYIMKTNLSRLCPAIARELTETEVRNRRKQAEEALHSASLYARGLIEASIDPLVTISPDGKITDVNRATETITGIQRERLIGDDFANYFTEPRKAREGYKKVFTEGLVRDYPLTIRHTSGKTTDVLYNATIYKNETGEIQGVFAAARDITERKRNEEAVRLSEEHYRFLFQNMLNGYAYCRMLFKDNQPEDFIYIDVNPAFEELTGLADVKGKKVTEAIPGIKENNPELFPIYGKVALGGPPQRFETYSESFGGWLSIAVYNSGKGYFTAIFENITERKKAEISLHHMNRELQAISKCNQTLIHAEDELALLHDICRIICDEAGYRMAWVGYAENDDAKTLRPIDWAGFEDGYLTTANITWADTERGRGPSGTSIRSGEKVYIQDYATNPRMALWREGALKRGYRSAIALPLKDKNAAAFGALTIYSNEPNVFTPDEIQLLEELTGDLAFGIVTLRARAERERAEEQLRLTDEIMRNVSEGIILIQANNGVILQTNPKFDAMFGYGAGELTGQNISIVNAPRDEKRPDQIAGEIIVSLTETGKWSGEVYNRKQDGTYFWCYANVSAFDHPSHGKLWVSVHTDITERKQAEAELKFSEEKFSKAFNASPNLMAITKPDDGQIYEINESFSRFFGYEREECIGHTTAELKMWADPDQRKSALRMLEETGAALYMNVDLRTKSGEIRSVIDSMTIININNQKYHLSVATDITERKQAEARYRSLFENAQEGIYRSTPEGRFILTNQSMAQILGYESSEDLIASITDIPRQLYVDSEERKKFIEIIEKQGFARNYESQFRRKDGRIIWISLTTTAIRDYKGQILYLEGIASDITDKKESVEHLRNTLNGTVRAIASIVETRDPYTAGHQRRVSDLACTIAADMGLSNDRIDGLRMAATIHDIGKISVPAEILSKPTKLTKIEFNLIKTHAQAGYDILQDIEFPWPVARMVIEHHERMNGSGYPNGITGDNILLESRILAVADVVEAMGSHRPYRASLGIEPALEEIEKNKGILYDTAAADACLILFREKGYQLT